MQAAEELCVMRENRLFKNSHLYDFHLKTAHYENSDKSVMSINIRLYQMNFRNGRDIYLYHDASINKIYRSLRGYEYLEIEDDYYSVETMRKCLGAIYRSRWRKCSVSVSDLHSYLCYHIDQTLLLIQKEKESKMDTNLTYSLIESS